MGTGEIEGLEIRAPIGFRGHGVFCIGRRDKMGCDGSIS